MDIEIIRAYPPNIAAIDAAFGTRSRPGVIYSWGPRRIYKPDGEPFLSPELLAHEGIHGVQQGGTDASIERWWEQFIADPAFRLAQELPAHVAEYRRFCSRHADPNKRARFLLVTVAKRLCGPLYGGLITHAEAMRKIRELR